MDIALWIVRVLLAGVFAVAGVAKLADRAGSRQAMIGFGIPDLLAGPLGILLPLTELAIAIGLLSNRSAWWAALAALLLLALFIAGISYNLARGRKPNCHCFGQLHSAPAGWATLVRNFLLAAVAGFVVGFGPSHASPRVLDLLSNVTAIQWLELVVGVIIVTALTVLSWVLLNVLRQQGRLLLRLEAAEAQLAGNGSGTPIQPKLLSAAGLPTGTKAPSFELPSLDGETLTLEALCGLGKPVMLIFSEPSCGPCTALLPEVRRWQGDHASKLVVTVVSRGSAKENRKLTQHSITRALLQKDREVAVSYQAHGTPSAVLIAPDGTIGSPLAQGAEAIRTLVVNSVRATRPSGLALGTVAPAFALPDLSGAQKSLADFSGRKLLLIFYNPRCGFCRDMTPELAALPVAGANGHPIPLVVTTGLSEETRTLFENSGVRCPVFVQEKMEIAAHFEVTGTPMGYLIDEKGRIASKMTAGARALFDLVANPPA